MNVSSRLYCVSRRQWTKKLGPNCSWRTLGSELMNDCIPRTAQWVLDGWEPNQHLLFQRLPRPHKYVMQATDAWKYVYVQAVCNFKGTHTHLPISFRNWLKSVPTLSSNALQAVFLSEVKAQRKVHNYLTSRLLCFPPQLKPRGSMLKHDPPVRFQPASSALAALYAQAILRTNWTILMVAGIWLLSKGPSFHKHQIPTQPPAHLLFFTICRRSISLRISSGVRSTGALTCLQGGQRMALECRHANSRCCSKGACRQRQLARSCVKVGAM